MFFQRKREEMPYGHHSGKPVRIASVEFRDGQQSLLATRMKTEDMLPILEKMDQVGYDSIEMWGGATFDVCLRHLNDDPWERIREFKKIIKKTPLRMLLRGQNLVGYKQYSDDIVEKFVERAAANGIDIFLVFDGLNDVRNTETAIRAVKKCGKRVEVNIVYTISPVHTIEKYVQIAKEYIALGVDAVHIEDMAGMVTPNEVFEVIKRMKKELKVPIHFQAHSTGGMAELCYWEAIRAGADVVDCDVSALALGTSHPSVESLAVALKGTVYDPKLNLEILQEINDYFMKMREKYQEYSSKFTGVDIGVLRHQIPGGMMSNLEIQLKEMRAEDKMKEILEEVHRVQKDFGYPPLATPFAQMVGSQATFNVVTGVRYQVIPKEVRDYVKGFYGRPAAEISKELEDKIFSDGEKRNTDRPGSLIPPQWEQMKEEAFQKGIARTEEDVLSYALFPQIAEDFLRRKYS